MKKFLLQFVSDIHLEYSKKIPNIKPIANNIALLGDIGSPRQPIYKNFLNEMSYKFDKVFIVSGNHEYWNLPIYGEKMYTKEEIDEMIENIVSKYSNVLYLNNKCYQNENITLIGSTLWSEIPDEKKEYAGRVVGDCRMIQYNNFIDLRLNNSMFRENVNFIEDSISQNLNKKIIVLTHHCPSYQYIAEKFKHYNNNYAFASNLDYLLKDPVCAWLAGHTHGNIHKIINNVICSINCLGYSKENLKDYNPEKCIEIKY